MVCLGPMFRAEVLPFLGVKETMKASLLSYTFNQIVDYNRHNVNSSPYLDKVLVCVENVMKIKEAFCRKHAISNLAVKHLKGIIVLAVFDN